MTTKRVWLLLSACALVSARALAADGGGVQLQIAGDDTLQRAAHTSIAVIASFDAENTQPLLLTPRIEGNAVELVRGRLLRADAKVQDATHLRFDLPVVARSEGTAILRVELTTYICNPDCHRVITTESRVLHVR